MELYLRHLEKREQWRAEATPIGLIICTGKPGARRTVATAAK